MHAAGGTGDGGTAVYIKHHNCGQDMPRRGFMYTKVISYDGDKGKTKRTVHQ